MMKKIEDFTIKEIGEICESNSQDFNGCKNCIFHNVICCDYSLLPLLENDNLDQEVEVKEDE